MVSFQEFFIEKTVLGLEEKIYIDGVGEVQAKLDTGNGAYNVLHGENIDIQNNNATFQTLNGITLSKPVEETITINVGAGNKEDRPVCLFDCNFGGKVFQKIPFSIGNRMENMHKVLIGKDFIKDQLDALIDVGLSNIAHQNITHDHAASINL